MQQLLDFLSHLSQTVPPELFIFLGAIIEEIVAPIPSSVVLTTAGGLLHAQDYPQFSLLFMALLAGVAKSIPASGFYLLADKTEDHLPKKIRQIFGLDKKELERYGELLSKRKQSFWLLLALWGSPLPTLPISLVSGFIKIQFRSFALAAIGGLTIRSSVYIFLGYYGATYITQVSQNLEQTVLLLSPLLVIAAAVALYFTKSKRHPKIRQQITNQLRRLVDWVSDAK